TLRERALADDVCAAAAEGISRAGVAHGAEIAPSRPRDSSARGRRPVTAMSDESTKICPRCLRLERPAEHPRSHFGPNRMTKDGLQHVCRRCSSETVKETRERQRREREHEKVSLLAIAQAGMAALGEVVPAAAGGHGRRPRA